MQVVKQDKGLLQMLRTRELVADRVVRLGSCSCSLAFTVRLSPLGHSMWQILSVDELSATEHVGE